MGKLKMKVEKTGNHVRIRKWYFRLDNFTDVLKSTNEEFSIDEFEFIDYDK